MIKVWELIEALNRCDPDRIVVLQRDPEGNGYSPLYAMDLENVGYQPTTPVRGVCGYQEMTDRLAADGYGEDDILTDDDVIPCIILAPMG